MTKPFFKWAGGKKVILKTLVENLPDISVKNYYEPFLGGGALFFHLCDSYLSGATCYLNDLNKPLINTYHNVMLNVNSVIEDLRSYTCSREEYYRVRELFSENKGENSVEQSARFIYLNKCGFNGLYRENKKGKFNVPYGGDRKVNICDEETLLRVNLALQYKVELSSVSFNEVFKDIADGDRQFNYLDNTLVYFDPPYHKEKGNSFTNYTGYSFGEGDHILLRNCADFLSCYGASVMLSNSDTEFVRELYKDYDIVEVVSRRSINRDGNGRKPKTELLVKNY